MKLYPLALVGFLAQMALAIGQTVPITVHWPEGVDQAYTIRGYSPPPITPKPPPSQSGTWQVPDGQHVLIETTGCTVEFDTLHGKILLPAFFNIADTGVRFDPDTSTFTFLALDVQFDLKDFDGKIALDLPAKTLAPGTSTWKLMPGQHILIYGTGNKVPFNLTADGFVTMLADVNGITSRHNVITIRGQPEVLSTTDGSHLMDSAAAGTVHLLPGNYMLLSRPGVAFTMDNRGWLGALPVGPFAERLALQDKAGGAHGTIMIPGGDALQAARLQQAKTDQDLHDRVLAATEKASWKQDFTLTDKMKLWDYDEQQVHYPVSLGAGADPSSLQLLAFTDGTVRSIPFQFSDDHATVYFRTDLPLGATRIFRLLPSADVGETVPKAGAAAPTFQATSGADTALLGNGLLFVKVPAGHRDFPGGLPFTKVAAPILGIGRDAQAQHWAAAESFEAPDSLLVTSMDAKMLASGPVFSSYQVSYQLSGGRTYAATLELRANESHVLIGEAVGGFAPSDDTFLHLDYGQGLCDPDRRLNIAHIPYSGNYDRNISTDDRFRPWAVTMRWLDYNPALDDSKVPRLDFRLGLFIPNTLGDLPSTTFYREDGDDALLLSIDKPEQWKESTRYIWTDYRAVDNLRFYQSGAKKYMATQLAGPRRFWALGVIPRSQVVMRAMYRKPASPDAWMCCDFGVWNLQDEIERSVDWDEDMSTPLPFVSRPASLNAPETPLSYDDYRKKYIDGQMVEMIRDFSLFYGSGLYVLPEAYHDYILSRKQWTPEQREQVRQTLVYITDMMDSDWVEPHRSMLAGHPNFINSTKQIVPLALSTFPNHPKAKYWRDSFMSYINEFLDQYTHKAVPELNTKGGRWTENIACYWGASNSGLLQEQVGLKAYDSSSIGGNPNLQDTIRWTRDAFMSPHDGVRMMPPEGAHAVNALPGRTFVRNFFRLCEEIAKDNPQLAAEVKWIETNGKEGTEPDIHSILYTDYGPIFHYDFGGPHESYAHMQNIYGMSYRWGYSGIVYYGAKGKVWSYNTMETNGDSFDWNEITDFTVDGKGLDPTPTDQLLYDFDFAQFYRVLAPQADAQYRARGLMLLRDDYLVLSDEVSDPSVRGTFNWVSVYDLPQFYQLKPGAPPVNHISRDPQPRRYDNPDRMGKMTSFTGQGDFLTVVAPAPVDAKAASFGATVNGEYVFASQKPETISEGPAVFSGNYGYARANQLALFQGTRIGLNGFTVSRDGGDFGLSAIAEPARITGRIVGRSGGTVSIVPPSGHDLAHAVVVYDGQSIPHTVENGAIVFPITIAQKDGLKNYAVTF